MTNKKNQPTKMVLNHAAEVLAGFSFSDARDLRAYRDQAKTQVLSHWTDPTTVDQANTVVMVKDDLPSGQLPSDIAHYWELEGDGAGGVVDGTDTVGAANLTVVAAPTSEAAQVGNGARINGTTQWFQDPSQFVDIDGAAAVAFGCWVSFDAFAALQFMFQMMNSSNEAKFNVFIDTGKILTVSGRSQIGESTVAATSVALSIDPSTLYHFVGVVDVENDEIRAYVNGAEVINSAAVFAAGTFTGSSSITNRTKIGSNTAGTVPVDGLLDDAWIMKRAPTADEVTAIYLRGLAGRRLRERLPTWRLSMNDVDNAGDSDLKCADIGSNGNHGTQSGGVTANSPGPTQNSQSYTFDGVDDEVRFPDDPSMDPHTGPTGTSSWHCMVKLLVTTTGLACVFAKDDPSGTRAVSVLQTVDGKLEAYMFVDGSNHRVRSTASPLEIARWYSYCVTWNASTQELHVFLDGSNVDGVLTSAGTVSMAATASDLTIGDAHDSSRPWNGQLSDFCWFSSEKTAEQIAEISARAFRGQRVDQDLHTDVVVYPTMDSIHRNLQPQDQGGNAVHGTLNGGVAIGQEGFSLLQSLRLDGTSGYVSAPDDPIFNAHAVGGSGKMTLVAAYRPDSIGSDQTIFAKWASTPNFEFRLQLLSSGKIGLELSDNANHFGAYETVATYSALQDLHIVATYDVSLTSGNRVFISVNGVDEALTFVQTGTFGGITPTVAIVTVGAKADGPGEFCAGLIDETKYYGDVAMTLAEREDEYIKWVNGGVFDAGPSLTYIENQKLDKVNTSSELSVFGVAGKAATRRSIVMEDTDNDLSDDAGGVIASPIGSPEIVAAQFGNGRRLTNGGLDLGYKPSTAANDEYTRLHIFEGAPANGLDELLWTTGDVDEWGVGQKYVACFLNAAGGITIKHSDGTTVTTQASATTGLRDGGSHMVLFHLSDPDEINVYIDGDVADANLNAKAIGGNTVFPDATNIHLGAMPSKLLTDIVPVPGNILTHLDAMNIVPGSHVTGNLLDTWLNNGASGGDATQTGANRPIYHPSYMNGRPAVLFPQNGDKKGIALASGVGLSGNDGYIFAAMDLWRGETAGAATRILLGANPLTVPFGQYTIGFSSGAGSGNADVELFTRDAGSADRSIYTTANVGTGPFILRSGIAALAGEIFYDGVTQFVTTVGGGIAAGTDFQKMRNIGGNPAAGGDVALDGAISELLIYDGALTAQQRLDIETYLGYKWGHKVPSMTYEPHADLIMDEVWEWPGFLSASQITAMMVDGKHPHLFGAQRTNFWQRTDPLPASTFIERIS